MVKVMGLRGEVVFFEKLKPLARLSTGYRYTHRYCSEKLGLLIFGEPRGYEI